jgi:hypothetical protein
MLRKDFRDYIEQSLATVANQRFPDDPQCASQYMLGYLTAQLAECMYDDNRAFWRFRQAVEATKQRLDSNNTK